MKLLQRLKLVNDSGEEKEKSETDTNYDDTTTGFDLETHLVENYDEYYDEYEQTTLVNSK